MPSLQAAIGEGLFVSPRPLTFETTVRAALSYLDPASGAEDFARRKLFDNRGFAAAGVFSSHGDYLYLALRGSRGVERIDALTGAQAGSILDVGFAPQGVALSPDDRLLFVDAYLSRELVVYDVSDTGALPVEVGRLPVASREPLSEEGAARQAPLQRQPRPAPRPRLLHGLRALPPRGLADRRVWDFTDRGEGCATPSTSSGARARRRSTGAPISTRCRTSSTTSAAPSPAAASRATRTSRRATIRWAPPRRGSARISTRSPPTCAPLDAHHASPFREAGGALPEAAARGRAVFESAGCPSCHAGPQLTDSALVAGAPLLHDVGTLGAGSGMRLGAPLTGIDTPTLHGLWESAPYLHDGSAPTLRDVLTTRNAGDRHGVTSTLDAGELDDLIAYLLCLDGRAD
ncbi:MAG: hypothetical protein M5U28_12265 [Sandaracinaceae bacterium]|nr:hypothetical protein [Sandaracinaceae bacterium]